jgi:hypothetical protein
MTTTLVNVVGLLAASAVVIGVTAYLWTAQRQDDEEELLRVRRAAWENHYAREQALRAGEASRRAEEAAQRAAEAEAYERDRPAREARARAAAVAYERDRLEREARAQAAAEAYERDRLEREARARAAAEARARAAAEAYERDRPAREARARARQAAEREVAKWCKLQTPIGSVCPSSSPADPSDARRQQGFFECREPECRAAWRSNDSWRGVKQVCPDCQRCAVLPFQWAALDRNDDGRVQRGLPYTGVDRSFGRFKCECGRPWQSAHAWAGETQACDSCRRHVGPFWQEALARGAERSSKDAADRRHNIEGCSKCQKVKQPCYKLQPASRGYVGAGSGGGLGGRGQ